MRGKFRDCTGKAHLRQVGVRIPSIKGPRSSVFLTEGRLCVISALEGLWRWSRHTSAQ